MPPLAPIVRRLLNSIEMNLGDGAWLLLVWQLGTRKPRPTEAELGND